MQFLFTEINSFYIFLRQDLAVYYRETRDLLGPLQKVVGHTAGSGCGHGNDGNQNEKT